MSRNRARVVTMQALFLLETDPGGMDGVIAARAAEEMLDADDMEYLRAVVMMVEDNRENLDAIIKEYSVDWDIGRLGKVERAVLRLALAELIYLKDVPADVAISEAVRIVKKYGTEHSGRFVNGILGKFARDGLGKYSRENTVDSRQGKEKTE